MPTTSTATPAQSARQERVRRFLAYSRACLDECVEPHSMHMWKIHGEPDGPI